MNNVTNVFPVKLVAVIWSPICSWSLKCSIALYKISFSLNYNPFLICPFVFPMLFLSLLVFFFNNLCVFLDCLKSVQKWWGLTCRLMVSSREWTRVVSVCWALAVKKRVQSGRLCRWLPCWSVIRMKIQRGTAWARGCTEYVWVYTQHKC